MAPRPPARRARARRRYAAARRRRRPAGHRARPSRPPAARAGSSSSRGGRGPSRRARCGGARSAAQRRDGRPGARRRAPRGRSRARRPAGPAPTSAAAAGSRLRRRPSASSTDARPGRRSTRRCTRSPGRSPGRRRAGAHATRAVSPVALHRERDRAAQVAEQPRAHHDRNRHAAVARLAGAADAHLPRRHLARRLAIAVAEAAERLLGPRSRSRQPPGRLHVPARPRVREALRDRARGVLAVVARAQEGERRACEREQRHDGEDRPGGRAPATAPQGRLHPERARRSRDAGRAERAAATTSTHASHGRS